MWGILGNLQDLDNAKPLALVYSLILNNECFGFLLNTSIIIVLVSEFCHFVFWFVLLKTD